MAAAESSASTSGSAASETAGSPRAHAHVASHTPGRLRVRVHHPARHTHLLHQLKQQLQAQPGVGKVDVNAHTGSVLVHYDRHTHEHGSLLQLFQDVGVTVGELARGLDMDAPEVAGHSKAGDNIVDTVTDLDRQVALLTGHKVDLKLLFPMALGGIGVWQVATRGLGLGEIPGYVLLWYAFDSFWKFHRTPAETPPPDMDAANGG